MKCTLDWAHILGAGCACWVACACHDVDVRWFPEEGYTFSQADIAEVTRIAEDSVQEARKLLPGLPERIVLEVRDGTRVIPETGENGTTRPPDAVCWTIDPSHPDGTSEIIRKWLRGTLFHELHHLVRDKRVHRTTLMDSVITEGMASAFERDAAGLDVPWARYSKEVEAWVEEVRALPPDTPRRDWLFRHPDGRRWVGYKVGTYLVDRAMRATGRSAAELVTEPTKDIVRWASGGRR